MERFTRNEGVPGSSPGVGSHESPAQAGLSGVPPVVSRGRGQRGGQRAAFCASPSRSLIAAGVNAKALSTYMGHASAMITLDRYGHLMPGNEEEAAALLDQYLSRSMS